MTNPAQPLDETAAAAHGLAITAASSALNRLLLIAGARNDETALPELRRLTEQAEKAATCMAIAGKAEADGDAALAEMGWQRALDAMNRLASNAAGTSTPAVRHNHPAATPLAS